MTLYFRQFIEPETSTYTYFIADLDTKEAVIVDSVKSEFQIYVDEILKHNFNLKFMLETHIHADHITANGSLQKLFPAAKIAISESAAIACERIPLNDNSEIQVGKVRIRALLTPGHTSESMCFLVDENRLLSGDTLLINSCGRTDFQAGKSKKMHESLQRLAQLPSETLVYPGHDYNKRWVSSIQEQLENNKLLRMSLQEFKAELESWKLAPPKYISVAVPGNQNCGRDGQEKTASKQGDLE